jgi:protease-4
MNDQDPHSPGSPSGVQPPALTVIPVRPRPPRSPWRGLLTALLVVGLIVAIPVGAIALLFAFLPRLGDSSGVHLQERFHSGSKSAGEKIAIVRIDGVLMEGATGYAQKQIERASEDSRVKAVVLRINSPGGSITASDDLHHRLTKLTAAKPVVVSMASLAASGGYFIAMPAKTLVAERTTMTGSIGVYAAFPNVKELGDKIGLKMIVVKRGAVKDSGSPFHDMRPMEMALWQDMVDHAYDQFKAVVEEGRPKLKGKLEEQVADKMVTVHSKHNDEEKPEEVRLIRCRADGGTFSADEALTLGLIDKIGYLEDAIQEAKQAAGLGDEYKAIQYDRPPSLLGLLMGVQDGSADTQLDPGRLANGAVPRLWYMAPQSELAGLLKAMGRGER